LAPVSTLPSMMTTGPRAISQCVMALSLLSAAGTSGPSTAKVCLCPGEVREESERCVLFSHKNLQKTKKKLHHSSHISRLIT